MEHNVFLQAFDKEGNMHTWKCYSIKNYLVNENHIDHDREWRFYKGNVNGVELEYSDKSKNLMRDVSDFKIYCRCNVDRKHIDTVVTQEILDKFLFEESEEKRKANYKAIQNGAKNLDFKYSNGGCGKCEYRPGYIEGYDFFNPKGVEITWINEDADACQGIVTRTTIFNRIRELITEGKYYKDKVEIKPIIQFYENKKQLQGQMSIMDFIGG